MIDFSPVQNNEIKMLEFSKQFTIDNLRTVTNESIDALLEMINGLNDEHVVFDPEDSAANDPYATEGEENIGWSIAHLVAHVTSSSEEGAAFSSMLARGVQAKLRNRYETPWRDITTHAQCVMRLEESRRMRLAFLDTWPDEPQLDVYRKVSKEFAEKFGEANAPAAFLFSLRHETGHYDQIREVRKQALAANT